MRKRIIIILLSLIMVTGSTMGVEMRAEASPATVVTGVTVGKAILFLLALAGVSVSSSSALDFDTYDFSSFENSLRTTNPALYTKYELWKAGIQAGKTSLVLTRSVWDEFRTFVRYYFGVSTGISTSIGTGNFDINELQISLGDSSKYIVTPGYGTLNFMSFSYTVPVIPVLLTDPSTGQQCGLFMPTLEYLQNNTYPTNIVGYVAYYGSTLAPVTYGSFMSSRQTKYWQIRSANFSWFKPSSVPGDTLLARYQNVLNRYYAGEFTSASESVTASPLAGVDDVATSVDNTLVGAGSTAQEEDNEIVIGGDIPLNLAGLNIDEWLKNLADSITDYQTAVKALGAEVVNTSTMTQEEISEIAQSLSSTVADTDYITGNYTVDLTNLFPFCIPFDLYRIIKCFEADPVAPSATVTIPVGYDGSTFTWQEYTVSLEDFNTVATVVRVFEYVLFVIGLMLITRKLIEG